MTDKKPTIHIFATSGIYFPIEDYANTLTSDYDVEKHYYERMSAADGSTTSEFIYLAINLKDSIADFLSSYLKQESLEYLFKFGILHPFYKWLQGLETFTADNSPKEIQYIFDDVTIKIGYSKSNHINAVGLICSKVNKIKAALEKENINKLTMVASPVKEKNGEWHFYSPDITFQINSYLDFLGLEINGSNRFILDKGNSNAIYKHWW